jgi:hypothetical protein
VQSIGLNAAGAFIDGTAQSNNGSNPGNPSTKDSTSIVALTGAHLAA